MDEDEKPKPTEDDPPYSAEWFEARTGIKRASIAELMEISAMRAGRFATESEEIEDWGNDNGGNEET